MAGMPASFDSLLDLIQQRRTSMIVDDGRPVPHDVVLELCSLAQWAPNHKRTWPWRFAEFIDLGRARLGAVISEAMERNGDEPNKVTKARTKYLRTPVVLVVGSAPGDSELRTAENRDAVAAGVQNLLLGATALGLASYWGSCPKGTNDEVAELCGFEPGTHVTAIIYLGWAAGRVTPPVRPEPVVRIIDQE
jgi:nitroreductase